ncbi:hypothetical protein PHYC_02938 [Phycisphaerales bacterium]|nr:hypothetical protein PHYC_02938 [Phycisphaerales bacterium]
MTTTPDGLNYRRLQRDAPDRGIRFLTWSCRHSLALFSNDAIRTAFVDHLMKERSRAEFRLHEFVVISTHVHLLIGFTTTIPARHVLTRIKGPFARRVIR